MIVIDGKKIGNEEAYNNLPDVYPGESGRVNVNEVSDIAESLKELNKDEINEKQLSAIDLRCRIESSELSGILTIDTLIGFRVLPAECQNFTLRKKRLSVSLNGKGRDEIVQMVIGDVKKKQQQGFGGKLKGLFGISPKNNETGGQQ